MKKALLMSGLVFTLFCTSCMTTKTDVAAYQETQGKEYTYSKGKQVWLFWGLVPMGRTKVSTPADGNCQVVTRFTIIDFLITGITAGIVNTETIKVNAKKKE